MKMSSGVVSFPPPEDEEGALRDAGPELIIGLVTPVGTDTASLVDALSTALDDFSYKAIELHLSEEFTNQQAPLGEREDERIRRLIRAGDDFCRQNASEAHPDGDPAAIARRAVRAVRAARLGLYRQDGNTETPAGLLKRGRPRTGYILRTLKRPAEVQLLRQVYKDQFILIGSQTTTEQRRELLMKRPMSRSDAFEKRQLVDELMKLDGKEGHPSGQRVNETYPSSDFFVGQEDGQPLRAIELLFGEPIAPTVSEFAMYIARASSARSLAASRKVGAALVVGSAVVATGYNDVPPGQTPDVATGDDTSEKFKARNVTDTMGRLREAGLLASDISEEDAASRALVALQGGELLSVIEYQRAVHAEAKTLDDAATRGVVPVGGDLYVTTYPCHLCYKHALSTKLSTVRYIDPYPKSRAAAMYPSTGTTRLLPYEGVAPRRYMTTFDLREPPVSDASGTFQSQDRRAAVPLTAELRDDEDRDAQERLAIQGLREEFR